MIRGGLGYAEN